MKHIVTLIAMAITCILVAVANVIITRMIGLNIFTLKIWFIIPAGAIGMGMLGASGAILAARYFNIQPTIIDADGHILEPPDLWEKYLEAKYRPRAIKIRPIRG